MIIFLHDSLNPQSCQLNLTSRSYNLRI